MFFCGWKSQPSDSKKGIAMPQFAGREKNSPIDYFSKANKFMQTWKNDHNFYMLRRFLRAVLVVAGLRPVRACTSLWFQLKLICSEQKVRYWEGISMKGKTSHSLPRNMIRSCLRFSKIRKFNFSSASNFIFRKSDIWNSNLNQFSAFKRCFRSNFLSKTPTKSTQICIISLIMQVAAQIESFHQESLQSMQTKRFSFRNWLWWDINEFYWNLMNLNTKDACKMCSADVKSIANLCHVIDARKATKSHQSLPLTSLSFNCITFPLNALHALWLDYAWILWIKLHMLISMMITRMFTPKPLVISYQRCNKWEEMRGAFRV